MLRHGETPDDPTDPPRDESVRLVDKVSVLLLWPEKFVTVFRRFFRSKPMACDVFGHNARDQEVQQIIFAAGFSAAAAHFESAEGMTADDCTGAWAIDVNITGFQLRFDALDVGWAAREKAAGQCVISTVGDFDCFIEVAHF